MAGLQCMSCEISQNMSLFHEFAFAHGPHIVSVACSDSSTQHVFDENAAGEHDATIEALYCHVYGECRSPPVVWVCFDGDSRYLSLNCTAFEHECVRRLHDWTKKHLSSVSRMCAVSSDFLKYVISWRSQSPWDKFWKLRVPNYKTKQFFNFCSCDSLLCILDGRPWLA